MFSDKGMRNLGYSVVAVIVAIILIVAIIAVSGCAPNVPILSGERVSIPLLEEAKKQGVGVVFESDGQLAVLQEGTGQTPKESSEDCLKKAAASLKEAGANSDVLGRIRDLLKGYQGTTVFLATENGDQYQTRCLCITQ